MVRFFRFRLGGLHHFYRTIPASIDTRFSRGPIESLTVASHAPPPRRARINPPLPVDEFGNWYESEEERAKKKRDENSDNLTAAERAILADLD